jgi:ABC-type bacteriocin/lantibiotic exporter with double-glycine peptidase domain
MAGHGCSFACLFLLAAAAYGDSPPQEEPQKENVLCGPRSLAYCLHLLGSDVSVSRVADLASERGNPTEGISLAALAKAATQLGYEGRCYRLRVEDLRRVTARTPGIAHVGGNHFVVVWMDGEADRVTVIDPPCDTYDTTLLKFARNWDGVIMIVSRPGEQPIWTAKGTWPAYAACIALGISIVCVLPYARKRAPRP